MTMPPKRLKKALSICILVSLVLSITALSRCVHLETVSGTPAKQTPLPIVMYHQLTTDPTQAADYCITVAQFERDLQYIQSKGYHTITVAQLLAHVNEGAALPKNPIMITVDDAFESIYSYGYPLLQQYDMCIVLAIIGAETDRFSGLEDHNLRYSYITWAEAKEMADSGHLEIQSHTYDLHKIANGRKGAQKKQGESDAAYRLFLTEDLQKMQEAMLRNTGYAPTALAFPFGSWSPESKDILADFGLQAAFTCEERINYIDCEDSAWLFRLRRFNRTPSYSSEAFFKRLGV